MINSGFFESVGTDRTYYADSFNTFFEGLIAANGIFENVGGGFAVEPAEGLTVNVRDGKAIVNNHWVRSDATEPLTIDTAHTLYNRYDMITLRWESTTRDVTLHLTKGTENTKEEKPQPIRGMSQSEIVLAYIYVKAKTSTITAANIIDCRYDTDICGVIASLIEQVNTSTLYKQYVAKFEEMVRLQQQWLDEQQTAFNTWFSNLTSDLIVATRLDRKMANVITDRVNGTQYIDLPASLEYKDDDILDVYVNGILMIPNTDYTLMMNEVENVPMVYFFADIEPDNIITFFCMKTDIAGAIENELSEIVEEQNEILGGDL